MGTRIPTMVVDAVNADHPHAYGDKVFSMTDVII